MTFSFFFLYETRNPVQLHHKMQMKAKSKKFTIIRRHKYLKKNVFNICKPNTCVIAKDPPLLDLYSTSKMEMTHLSEN